MAQISNRITTNVFRIAAWLFLMLASSTSSADDGTAALIIEGYIAERLEIRTESYARALDIDFSEKGQLEVGVISYYSNSSSGYKITLKSKNFGELLHEKAPRFGSIKYQAYYEGVLVSQLALASDEGAVIVSQPRAVSERGSGSLAIQFEGVDSSALPAGTYHDVLTAVISAQ